jgi:hypothetical protein
MPNWCQNKLIIWHEDPEVIDNLMAQVRAGEGDLFTFIKPMPQELRDTVKGTGDEEQTTEYDGHTNWYDWACDNWSTKWDACHLEYHQTDERSVTFEFDSAWCPPFGVYEALVDQDFDVDAYYVEYGMMFAGVFRFSQPNDSGSYQIDDISEGVTEELDEHFGITEQLEEWAEEEKEYANG